jgi:DNA-binding transcriptional MocR family regulator
VITVGSLSKALWGGIRVGWARAQPALIRRLASSRSGVDLSSPVLEQLIATEALSQFDEVLGERLALARAHRAALTAALAQHLPDWRHNQPAGGLSLWVELPQPMSTSLAVLARDHGLALTPGSRFAASGLLERYLRLPFTARPAELETAVRLMAQIAPSVALEPEREMALSGYAV